MTPTPKLRFVLRKIQWDEMEESSQLVRILQQWWQTNATGRTSTNGEDWITTYAGEWRDVPVEKESA